MSNRPPCSQCGNRDFEEEDGRIFCLNGHVQAEGLQVAEDEADFASRGKITRKKEEKIKQKRSRIYRGVKAYRLFLQAWQFILWKQCYMLVHEKNVPRELWTIVRDLWTLRLSSLTHRIEDVTTAADVSEDRGVSSAADTETDIEGEHEDLVQPLKMNPNVKASPTLWDSIALNVVGLMLLRYPIHLAAIYRYIREEQICFIRAIRQVPSEMRERLPLEYRLSLDTTVIPKEEDLQKAIYRCATMYGTSFGMAVPPINWNILLFEYIHELSLPLNIYPTVKKLVELTRLNFSYVRVQRTRRTAITYPEAQLMALVAVGTKLLYPFDSDSTRRSPQSIDEPATMQIDWTRWKAVQEKYEQESKLTDRIEPGEEIKVTDAEVMAMSDAQLDQYMDWFQHEWAEESVGSTSYQDILNMFPTNSQPTIDGGQRRLDAEAQIRDRTFRRLEESIATTVKPNPHTPDDESGGEGQDKDYRKGNDATTVKVLRPGQQYQRFHKLDDMSTNASAFHREAASRACLTVETLLRAVLQVENLLVHWQRAKKRADVFGEDIDLDAEIGR